MNLAACEESALYTGPPGMAEAGIAGRPPRKHLISPVSLQALRRSPGSAPELDPAFGREALHPGHCASQALAGTQAVKVKTVCRGIVEDRPAVPE